MSQLFRFKFKFFSIGLPLMAIVLLSNACSNVQSVIYEGLTAGSSVGLLAHHKIKRTNHWVLSTDSSFYVAVNAEGSSYTAAIGVKVADLIHREISQRFSSVIKASNAESMDYARNSALLNQLDYLVYPKIFIWRDTPGTWTEIWQLLGAGSSSEIVEEIGLDKLMLQLVLLESSTGRIIDIASIESQSGLLTLYDESPDSLFAGGVGQYFESLQRY